MTLPHIPDPMPGDALAADALPIVIIPRIRDIGDFEVRRALPSAQRQMVGPFIFFDQFGPITMKAGQGQDVRVLAGVNRAWYDCILTHGNVCRSAVQPKRRSKPLSHKGNSSQRGLGVLAFDVTFSLIRNGVDAITAPNRSKSMPFSKAPTGWSSQSSRATFESWERTL